MAVATSAVSFLVGKLREELSEDIILLRNARAQIEWVETEFRRMGCFLKDADGMQEEESEVTKNWTQEVRDLTYHAEDVIDIFFLRIAYAREAEGCWGQFKRYLFILNEVAACRKVASEVEWMKQRLRSISENQGIYSISFKHRGGPSEERRLSSPQHHPLHGSGAEDEKLVGLEKELPKWVELLMKKTADAGQEERRVLCIVGAAGLGKSAVANKLYNDERLKESFPVRAWVFVSRECSQESIYESLLAQFRLEKRDKIDEVLRNKIDEVLRANRYLIVVDDVCDNNDWDELAKLFPDPKNGSRIILTSRDADVGRYATAGASSEHLFYLQPLSEKDSWQLFLTKTNMGGMDKSRRKKLEHWGREIVKKCEGVPLAIVSIAGVLAGKEEVSAWEHASKSISYLLTGGEKRTSGILHLSYRYLPYQLKPCFLYLAGFPEVVRARKLIRMWAAEGLLEERGEESLEDVGEDCLQGLVQRSLVRVVERSSTGGIKSCCIHSLQHHVALSEAKTNNFLQVHHYPQKSTAIVSRFPTKARRLAIHGGSSSDGASTDDQKEEVEDDFPILGSNRGLRTVLIYPKEGKEKVGKQLLEPVFGEYKWLNSVLGKCGLPNWILGEYKLLRVLDLQKAEIEEVPSQIGNLVHLRYLALTFTLVQSSSSDLHEGPRPITLPGSIDTLRSLQTLECYYPFGIRIPSSSCSIQKMQSLRHVLLKSPYGFEYPVIGASRILEDEQGSASKAVRLLLRNLHTLTNVFAGEWLKNCSRLRKLGITIDPENTNIKYDECIANLLSLRSLSISVQDAEQPIPKLPPLDKSSDLCKLSLNGPLEKLPEPHEFPSSLIKLTFTYSQLEEKDVGTLGKLNNLRILRLMEKSYKDTHMTWPNGGGFPALECLHLEKLRNLNKLTFQAEATPKLLCLNIYFCEEMTGVPEGVEYLKKNNQNFKMDVKKYDLARCFKELENYLKLLAAI